MTTFKPNEDYTIPTWSARPNNPYFLEVLKNGIEQERKQIHQKAMYLVGKHGAICDIILDNPSISRKHALFQSRDNGDIYVYDLNSTHGTYVNNIKIPSKLFHKLKVFDQIKFGQSQRVYILRCDQLENQDREEQEKEQEERLKKRQAKKEFRTLKEQYLHLLEKDQTYGFSKILRKDLSQQKFEGIDWGITDEEEIYRYQVEHEYPLEPELLRQLQNLTIAQTDKINTYVEKLFKFRETQEELDQIIAKEKQNYGLEEVNKKKKESLMARIESEGSSLEQAEETCRFVLFGDRAQKKNFQYAKQDSSEDDEYYDNTLAKKKQKKNNEPHQKLEQTTENFNQLKNKLDNLREEERAIQEQLLNLTNEEEKNKNLQDADELDVFMNSTVQNLVQEQRPKLIEQLTKIQQQIDRVTGQLQTVKPDVIINLDDMFAKPQGKKQTEPSGQQRGEPLEKNQKDTIKEKIGKIREMQKEKSEEELLKEAEEFFKIQEQRRLKEEEIERKRQERKKILDEYEEEDQQLEKETKKQVKPNPKPAAQPQPKPHSRHYRDNEIEKEQDFVDITKFQ